MTIKDGDIVLLASKVMADVPEGGGGPTGRAIEWGKSNQIFDDPTEVARAGGSVSIRQVHVAVRTPDTQALMDATYIVDMLPTDPSLSVTLAACDTFATRTEIAEAAANYFIASVETSWVLFGNHVKGQANLQLFHRVGTPAPTIRRTLVLVEHEGQVNEKRSYIRVDRTSTTEQTFTYIVNGTPTDYKALVTTCELESRLDQAFTGSEPNRAFQREANAARIRDTTVADAVRFYGASPTTAAYTLGDPKRQVKVSSIYTQLVPSSRAEQISLDQRPAAMRSITLATGPREVTVAVAPHTKRFKIGQENQGYSYTSILRPFPSRGTVVVSFMVMGTWYTCQDNGLGELVGDATGTVSYTNGNISISLPEYPDVGSAIVIQWGETTGFTNRSGSAATVRQPEFAVQLPHGQIERGSISIQWTSGGITKTLADASTGNALTGTGGAGLVHHASGRLLLRPTAWIDAGGEFSITYQRSTTVTHTLPAPAIDAAGFATITLPSLPAPGSIALSWLTVRSVTASSGASSGGGTSGKSSADMSSSWGNGHASQSSSGWSTTAQRISQTQDQVEHLLIDDGAGGFSGRGSANYGTGALTVKLVDLNATTDSYQSDYEKSSAFESQSGPGTVVTVGGGGSSMKGGNYSLAAMGEQVLAASTLTVTYAETFDTTLSETYSWQPPAMVIDLCPLTSDYVVPGSVQFTFLGHTYIDVDGDLIRDRAGSNPGVVAGRMDYEAGLAFLEDWVVTTSAALVLQSLWTTRKQWTTGSVFFRTPNAPVAVQGLTLNITDANGNVIALTPDLEGYFNGPQARGRLDHETGLAEIQFGALVLASGLTAAEKAEWWYDAAEVGDVEAAKVWKPLPVDPTTLRFNVVSYVYMPVDEEIVKMPTVRLPANGRVPIFRRGEYLYVHHTAQVPAATLSNGQTIDCGRERLMQAWIVGADGQRIESGWSADLNAGLVEIEDTTDWVQPVEIFHRIQEMARAQDVAINGTITLSKALSHDFPVGSIVSSALYIGTLQARVSHLFDQENWTSNNWTDTPVGNGTTAQFNDTVFPPQVTNIGAITERWVLRRKTSTTVELFGQHVGMLGEFPVSADIAPINPNTKTDEHPGYPYFVLPAGGWGGSWPNGSTLHMTTVGAQQAVAIFLTTMPSSVPSVPENYRFSTITGGDIDRAPV